jgi:hypothetical protein
MYGSVQLDLGSARAVDMARRMNDLLAERINDHPDRFSGFLAPPHLRTPTPQSPSSSAA